MARKTIGHVELEWTCPNCGSVNPGPHMFCTNCGAPQPDGVEFRQKADAELITDEETAAKVAAGPDIQCPYCETRNAATNKFCSQCGGDLSEGARRQAGQVLGAYITPKTLPPVNCPNCGTQNPGAALTCSACGATLAKPAAPAIPIPPTAPGKKSTPVWMLAALGGVVVLICGALVLFAILAGRTQGIRGTVEAVRWERAVPVEAMLPVEYTDWIDEIPDEAENVTCESRVRETVDQPVEGALEVCGTPYTVDTGTGYGEVVQDCVYEVYDDYCNYSVLEWQVAEWERLSGENFAAAWPEPILEEGQRLGGNREESYVVFFEAGDENYTYELGSFEEFQQFAPGSTWTLNINTFGAVVSVEP